MSTATTTRYPNAVTSPDSDLLELLRQAAGVNTVREKGPEKFRKYTISNAAKVSIGNPGRDYATAWKRLEGIYDANAESLQAVPATEITDWTELQQRMRA